MTVGNFEQTSIETFFGISGAAVGYSPSCTDTVSGTTSLDGVWIDDTIVAIEETLVPGTAEFFSFGSRPGMTQDGTP